MKYTRLELAFDEATCYRLSGQRFVWTTGLSISTNCRARKIALSHDAHKKVCHDNGRGTFLNKVRNGAEYVSEPERHDESTRT